MLRDMRTSTLLTKPLATRIIKPHSEVLVGCFDGAFDDWAKILGSRPTETAGLSTRTRTCFIHDRVVYRLQVAENAGETPGLRVRKVRGLNVAILNDRLMLKFKKLDNRLRSRNIPTGQTIAFDHQTPLIASSVGRVTNATSGYVADDTTGSGAAIVVVCWNGEDQFWDIPLRGGSAEGALEIPAEPTTPKRARTRVVKPRAKPNLGDA